MLSVSFTYSLSLSIIAFTNDDGLFQYWAVVLHVLWVCLSVLSLCTEPPSTAETETGWGNLTATRQEAQVSSAVHLSVFICGVFVCVGVGDLIFVDQFSQF